MSTAFLLIFTNLTVYQNIKKKQIKTNFDTTSFNPSPDHIFGIQPTSHNLFHSLHFRRTAVVSGGACSTPEVKLDRPRCTLCSCHLNSSPRAVYSARFRQFFFTLRFLYSSVYIQDTQAYVSCTARRFAGVIVGGPQPEGEEIIRNVGLSVLDIKKIGLVSVSLRKIGNFVRYAIER